jgi:hypothetical protein
MGEVNDMGTVTCEVVSDPVGIALFEIGEHVKYRWYYTGIDPNPELHHEVLVILDRFFDTEFYHKGWVYECMLLPPKPALQSDKIVYFNIPEAVLEHLALT